MADAAVSFKTFRDHEELRELVENDLALLLTERFVSPAGRTARDRRAQLPSAVDAFVGRESELEALTERLAGTARLVTVTGPGGVGKTRLAIEAAHRSLALFPDGVHFVGLSAVPEAELVPSAILTTLELPTAPTRAVNDALIDHLRDGELLLAARQLRARPRCRGRNRELAGRLHESATARDQPKPPQIEGRAGVCRCAACRFRRPCACLPNGHAAVTSEFELTDTNATPVGEICRHLDGLPLAIELAAARVRTLPAESMLPHLERRLDFLTGGGRDYPERQPDIAGDDRLELRAPRALGAGAPHACERLSRRLGSGRPPRPSAVRPSTSSTGSSRCSKRAWSGSRSSAPGLASRCSRRFGSTPPTGSRNAATRDDSRSRHARFYLDLALTAGESLRGGAQRVWLDKLELEQDNVREALRWSLEHEEPDRVASAGWALMPFWWLRGLFDEGTRWMNQALAKRRPDRRGTRGGPAGHGFHRVLASGLPHSGACAGGSARDLHVGRRRAPRRFGPLPLATVSAAAGDATAIASLEECRAVLEETRDEWGLMIALNGLCWALNLLQLDSPLEPFEEARARANAVGTTAELATAIGNLSRRRRLRGETAEAKVLLVRGPGDRPSAQVADGRRALRRHGCRPRCGGSGSFDVRAALLRLGVDQSGSGRRPPAPRCGDARARADRRTSGPRRRCSRGGDRRRLRAGARRRRGRSDRLADSGRLTRDARYARARWCGHSSAS